MNLAQTAPTARTHYHHGDLRAAMLRATEQIVVELGPEAVSVREVARRAGVSSGAPFHHFSSRRALMTAVAEEATHRLRQCIQEAVAEVSEGKPHRRLRAMARAWLRWVVENPAQFRIVSDRTQIDDSEAIKGDDTAIQSLMRDALRQAIRHGGKHDVTIDQAMLELRATTYGLARMSADGHLPQWGVTETDPLEQLEKALARSLARLLGKKAG